MPRKPRILECPQCGAKIRGSSVNACSGCGYVLDMARISFHGALRHDRYDEWRRRMDWVYLALWTLVSGGWLVVVCLWPTQMVIGLAAVAALVQVALGRLLILRRKRR